MGSRRIWLAAAALALLASGLLYGVLVMVRPPHSAARPAPPAVEYKPRRQMDTSGFLSSMMNVRPWKPDASLFEVADAYRAVAPEGLRAMDRVLAGPDQSGPTVANAQMMKAILLNFKGEPRKAYELLGEMRARVAEDDDLAADMLYSVIFYQGVTALRCGETENCVLCRGESSCILPIAKSALHKIPLGSRQAIAHCTEYLERFPEDLEVRWILNLAYMTLGEHPDRVDPRYLISLDRYAQSAEGLKKFTDVGEKAGVNRLNQAGGAIMDDFDGDGLLDIVVTAVDQAKPMAFYRNKGDGTFEDRTTAAKLDGQLGGLNCVQTDYNNDGFPDIFIPRGAWLPLHLATRPSLLRNNGDGTFTDVTREAGLIEAANSISASWADFDNDGFLDLFLCCERQPNRLFRNKGDGTFEDVAARAGVTGGGVVCKGAAWIDIDNDGFPDLFLSNMTGPSRLFRNKRDGTFADVTEEFGVRGPATGFSCWAWDYDNDGWLDLFVTAYDGDTTDVVKGLMGQPHKAETSKLYRNVGGKGFQDVTAEAGLDAAFLTMGSNFADFDGDGYLDAYFSTGGPGLATLVPNRLFKNHGGRRFAEATVATGTGHLQKGHGVACGDWRRTGDIDLFVELGGQVPGDQFHNVLFQNPGHGNAWLTVKLVGKKTNRPGIGARIKVVTAAAEPLTVCRHVTSGSSFGANPLQQTIGLGKATGVAALEIHWPTSGTTQVFRDVPVNQAVEVTEFAATYRTLDWKPVPAPK